GVRSDGSWPVFRQKLYLSQGTGPTPGISGRTSVPPDWLCPSLPAALPAAGTGLDCTCWLTCRLMFRSTLALESRETRSPDVPSCQVIPTLTLRLSSSLSD